MLRIEDIYQAQTTIKDKVFRTPLIEALLPGTHQTIYLKCESLQKTGSFKIRGATNFMSQLTDEEKARGVVAWSAGNHAQGVALAAQLVGIRATICIPSTGSISKISATRGYGAQVVLSEGVFDDARKEALQIHETEGAIIVPPFDHEHIIAGQGTIGIEIFEDLPHVDSVVIPIGGGGLIAGIAFTLKQLKPSIKIYGVEAENAASMKQSLAEGTLVTLAHADTIADGIAIKAPSQLTFDYTKRYVDQVVSVSEAELSDAILYLAEKQHLIVEGAGAAGYAALMTGKLQTEDHTVCVISGGNIDIGLLNKVLQTSLARQRRILELKVEITDRSGSLNRIIDIVSKHQGNIITVNHQRSRPEIPIGNCIAQILFEMPYSEDISHLESSLAGYTYSID